MSGFCIITLLKRRSLSEISNITFLGCVIQPEIRGIPLQGLQKSARNLGHAILCRE